MPDLDLDAIEARAQAATPGPWHVAAPPWNPAEPYVITGNEDLSSGTVVVDMFGVGGDPDDPKVNREANLAFIAHARADVPALLADVKRLRDFERQVVELAGRSKVARDEWIAQCAELGIDPGQALRAATKQRAQAVKAEVMVTEAIAAHVLFHFGAGGYEAGSFTMRLIELIARADPGNRALLGLGFPGYVAAVGLADRTTDGIAVLQKIAAGEQAPAPASGADLVLDHIANCTDVGALVVAQSGSLHEQVAEMVADGWTLDDRVDYVAGKRIRYLTPPPGAFAAAAEKGCSCTPDPDTGDLHTEDGGRCSHDG